MLKFKTAELSLFLKSYRLFYVVPERGFEPLSLAAADFESAMYTIPSLWQVVTFEIRL